MCPMFAPWTAQGKQCHAHSGDPSAPGSFCLEWEQAAAPFATISNHMADVQLVQVSHTPPFFFVDRCFIRGVWWMWAAY